MCVCAWVTLREGSEVEHRSRVAAGVQDVILVLEDLAAACGHPADPFIFIFIFILYDPPVSISCLEEAWITKPSFEYH